MAKLIVGNKTDADIARVVSYEQGEQAAKHYGASFIEASARANQNVKQAFEKMARQLKESSDENPLNKFKQDNISLRNGETRQRPCCSIV